jgi:hypothetical protein
MASGYCCDGPGETARFAGELSKAEAKISKRFARAEYSDYRGPLGCQTTGDVATMGAKAEDFTQDILDDLCPPSP